MYNRDPDRKYRVQENYFSLKKRGSVDERRLSIFLRNNSGVWRSYTRRCGEPSECSHIGMDEYDYPDSRKIFRCFLEDLLGMGVVREIKPRTRRRK